MFELIVGVILIIINISGLLYARKVFHTLGSKAIESKPPAKALTVKPVEDHKLLETWIETDGDGVIRGWRSRCSCGAVNYATNATLATDTKRATYGTEANVIEAHMTHAKNFKLANGNEWKDRHDELQKKFDEAQEKCYCKEISPVQLIALRD